MRNGSFTSYKDVDIDRAINHNSNHLGSDNSSPIVQANLILQDIFKKYDLFDKLIFYNTLWFRNLNATIGKESCLRCYYLETLISEGLKIPFLCNNFTEVSNGTSKRGKLSWAVFMFKKNSKKSFSDFSNIQVILHYLLFHYKIFMKAIIRMK